MPDVEIKLDGNPVTLRPTLKAARRVSAAGGFQNVVNRLQTGDIDAYINVVGAGLDKKPADIEEAVFRTGLLSLADKLVRFVNLLANGGKPFKPQKLKTVEIDGKVYAEIENGEPVYIDDEPASGGETAGEG